MSNKVTFSNEAIIELKKGIDIGANAAKATLGYAGRTIFISKKGFPTEATKDGVTVITSIRLKDPIQDAGLKLIQEISQNTAKIVGDGTTSVVVLMQEMIEQGILLRNSGINLSELKTGMEMARDCVVAGLKAITKDIGNDKKVLRQVASVSANNDKEVGDLVGSMYETIGKYGTIHIEDGNQVETTMELVKGFGFQSGYFQPYFINTKENTCELASPYILMIEGKVTDSKKIFPIIEKVIEKDRPIVVMAEDFDHSVMADVLNNVTKKIVKASLIKYTVSGEAKEELLFDLCAFTGATLITDKTGQKIENIGLESLGECEKIVSTKDETTVFNGKNNKREIALRIHDAKMKIEQAKNEFVKAKYQLRLSKLEGAVAVCYVGGTTDVERGERKDRIDDAVRATKAAIEEGIVPGGGTALIRCIADLSKIKCESEAQRAGVKLVQQSIEKPLFQICENAGVSGKHYIEKVKEKSGSFGYNAKTGKIENLFKSGIIDPAKVVRVCIENSISGAIQFLMSQGVITDEI